MEDKSKYFPKRDYKIFAVDFDGTLTLNKECEPRMGEPNILLINFLIKMREFGNKVILWTCRVDDSNVGNGHMLADAIEYCKEYGLEFDAVNDNISEIVEFYRINARKITADYYIDDKSVPIYRLGSFVEAQIVSELRKQNRDNPVIDSIIRMNSMATYGMYPQSIRNTQLNEATKLFENTAEHRCELVLKSLGLPIELLENPSPYMRMLMSMNKDEKKRRNE